MGTRGRPRKGGTPFDLLIKQHCQRGLASLAGGGGQDRSKSSGGAWGSFTTIKAASSSSLASSGGNFWSREENDDAAEYGLDGDPTCLKRPAAVVGSAKPKKFFKSRDGNRCRNSSDPEPAAAAVEPAVPLPRPLVQPPRPLILTEPATAAAPATATSVVVVAEQRENFPRLPPLKLRIKTSGFLSLTPRKDSGPEAEEKLRNRDDFGGNDGLEPAPEPTVQVGAIGRPRGGGDVVGRGRRGGGRGRSVRRHLPAVIVGQDGSVEDRVPPGEEGSVIKSKKSTKAMKKPPAPAAEPTRASRRTRRTVVSYAENEDDDNMDASFTGEPSVRRDDLLAEEDGPSGFPVAAGPTTPEPQHREGYDDDEPNYRPSSFPEGPLIGSGGDSFRPETIQGTRDDGRSSEDEENHSLGRQAEEPAADDPASPRSSSSRSASPHEEEDGRAADPGSSPESTCRRKSSESLPDDEVAATASDCPEAPLEEDNCPVETEAESSAAAIIKDQEVGEERPVPDRLQGGSEVDQGSSADTQEFPAGASDDRLSELHSLQKAKSAPVASFSLSSLRKTVSGGSESSEQLRAAANKPSWTKKSIFKSKKDKGPGGEAGEDGTGRGFKGRSLYKHKWNADEAAAATTTAKGLLSGSAGKSSSEFDDDNIDEDSKRPSMMAFSSGRLVRVPSAIASSAAVSSGPEGSNGGSGAASAHSTVAVFEDPDNPEVVVSVKCPKAEKGYFTVIKNVKQAHQIQDSGEFQEFNDDVEYILEGLGGHNKLSTRCLSTVTLASKCMEPSFRMHLRAHGSVTKFFAELKDAPDNPSLALCAATVLFVLSQDRLNMDLDRDSLELMLNLLDTDSRIKDALEGSGMNKRELEKNKAKVQELCSEMKGRGRAANLSLDHISADHLSMETLLSLTSRRAGEWFKEELRQLGGLDHLVRTLSDCVAFLTADDIAMWTDPLHTKLKKADRVLKVLESVTHENEENCQYLLQYRDGMFLTLIHSFLKLLDEEVALNPSDDIHDKESVPHTLRESLLDVLRVYINLVHDFRQQAVGSRIGGQMPGIFDICLHIMFILPDYVPEEKRFDTIVLVLTLLINLVENCAANRTKLMDTQVPQRLEELGTAGRAPRCPQGLVRLFLQKEENARRLESKTDKILDGKEDEEAEDDGGGGAEKPEEDKARSHEELIDETVKKLLNKAGKHMEDTLVASYLTLIVGYLILDNKEHEATVRDLLPDKNFAIMVGVLKKFFTFMNLTASSSIASNRGLAATKMILAHLENLDAPAAEQEQRKRRMARTFDRGSTEADASYGESGDDDLTLFDVSRDDEEDEEDDGDQQGASSCSIGATAAGRRRFAASSSPSSYLDPSSDDTFGKI